QDVTPGFTEAELSLGVHAVAELNQALEKKALETMEQMPPAELAVAGVPIVRAIRHGVPFHEIEKYAKEIEADLLVLATHGRTGLAHFLLGSVAERVVRTAPCPVLTVRHPEHEFIVPG
ncbi:MAG: universal stress protein, partial [Planctomycetia bacterium]